MPILCHHLAGVKAREEPPHVGLQEVLASAKLPNIYIKLSGFAYCSQVNWDYPYSDTHWVVRSLYEHFGIAWDTQTDTSLREHASVHRQNRFGEHTYTLEEFGLEADTLQFLETRELHESEQQ